MHKRGSFLKSKVAKRIAFLLLLASVIPIVFMSILSRHNLEQLSTDYEQKALVDKSHNYAINVLTNLIFARTSLIRFSENLVDSSQSALNTAIDEEPIFNAMRLVKPNGEVLSSYGRTPTNESIERYKQLAYISNQNVHLIVSKDQDADANAKLSLVLPRMVNGRLETLLIGDINPNYLWGKKTNYSDQAKLCAYQIGAHTKTRLFCSSEMDIKLDKSNSGHWQLSLKEEFAAEDWQFEIMRANDTDRSSGNIITNNTQFTIGILSVLTVSLLGLIQIRQTMVPLERIIEGTKKVAKGEFEPVQVEGNSEFSVLANAFNGMSSHIKRQFETLQSLSEIDREIASNLDVDQIIRQVTCRMHEIKSDASFYVFRIIEEVDSKTQCSVNIHNNSGISSMRISITTREINSLKSHGLGRIVECNMESAQAHERLVAELGDAYAWVEPIFWQGEMCAFVAVGSKAPLDATADYWQEFRELSNRIGIVITAQGREEQLLVQAQYDILTGLPNRILLHDRLRQAMDFCSRTNHPIWVLFMDLDRFKYINDSMGHQAGDDLLVQVSKRLQNTIRESDTVARFGGDEFVIILQGEADDNHRLNIVKRLVDAVSAPMQIEKQEVVVTCSVGISVYPADGTTSEDMIKHADIAMYRAKELGKNNFQFFIESMNEIAAERMRMERHLRSALKKNEFVLAYQPKVDLNTQQIVGMEALVRWHSPELGTVSPSTFIPLAEETGQVLEIGEWVLRTACAQAVKWRRAGMGELLISVNLSARQLNQRHLVEKIRNILVETGLNAENLELELTESLFMREAQKTLKTLHEIKALGIQLSVDDFGTGYSNLSYLNSLPLDTLKIDKTFTDDILLNSKKAPIVDTIIALAKNLDLKIVAEGVESETQINYLTARGCDQVQGYYYSQPISASEFETLFSQNKKLHILELKPVSVAKKISLA